MLLGIIFGEDGKVYRSFKDPIEPETMFLGLLIAVLFYVFIHYSPKELWNKVKSYFMED